MGCNLWINLLAEMFFKNYCIILYITYVFTALLGNDTVIGDPLYTVPMLTPDGDQTVNLCYEVRGRPNCIFNLVSDTCVSVNAYYSPADNPQIGNVISQISVRAVGLSGQCYNIHVNRQGCTASMSSASSNLNDFVQIAERFLSDGIHVRRYSTRVRIAVPNCENLMLVMWVTCEVRSGQDMIRFDISRGLNLRQTSHGLLGMYVKYYPYPLRVFMFAK